FEDDDYGLRTFRAGDRNLLANDVFIHHVGPPPPRTNFAGPTAGLDVNPHRLFDKWGAAAAPPLAPLWASYEEHVELLAPEQYALPGWATPALPAPLLARHLAKVGRRLGRLGWHAAARAAFQRSLRISPTVRGVTGWVWNLRPGAMTKSQIASSE